MKHLILVMAFLSLSACVTTKKHELVCEQTRSLQFALDECKLQKSDLAKKIDLLEKDVSHRNEKIKDQDETIVFVKSSNESLTQRLSEISSTTQINAEIMKKTLNELNISNQKLLDLSLIVDKKDSINTLLLKRANGKLSDKRLKKSLEKLGFAFF